jgi:phage terminase large subunit
MVPQEWLQPKAQAPRLFDAMIDMCAEGLGPLPEVEEVDLQPINNYVPYGAALKLWNTKNQQVVISGPSETGKTLAALRKLDALMWQYPRAQAAIVRKTYQSTISTVLQTYERLVLGENSPVTKQGKSRPTKYEYPNGSQVWIGGMDNPTRVLSSERDVIYVNQAEELDVNEWETLATRATGRAGGMPYGQLIGDCNPSAPTHWIKQFGDEGRLEFLESRHLDNPTLFNPQTGAITDQGRRSLAVLQGLTGVRKKRYCDGIWAAAEGMVYEDVWDPAIHIIARREIPAEWPRFWTVDFGYTNPFAWSAWAQDGDGRLIRYREVYHTQRTVEDHLAVILGTMKDEPRPQAIIVDHDAEDRATFEQHNTYCSHCKLAIRSTERDRHSGHTLTEFNLRTTAAYKSISPGIQAVTQRLRKAGDDKPRLMYMRDSLVERDQRLIDARKPCCAEEEYESYVWPKGSDGRSVKETPVAENNHGLDKTRYLVCYVDNVGRAAKKIMTAY